MTNPASGMALGSSLPKHSDLHLGRSVDRTVYVSASGNDANNGFTLGTAVLTLAQAVTNLAGNGGTVIVGPGTFTLAAYLHIPSNTTIRGSGRFVTTITIANVNLGDSGTARGLFSIGLSPAATVSNVVVEHLGFNVPGNVKHSAIFAGSWDNLTVRHCYFTGAGTNGADNTDGMVRLGTWSGAAAGLDGTKAYVHDNHFIDCTTAAGVIVQSPNSFPHAVRDVYIDRNVFQNVCRYGVKLSFDTGSTCFNVKVRENTFANIIGRMPGGTVDYGWAVHAGLIHQYTIWDVEISGNHVRSDDGSGQCRAGFAVYQMTGCRITNNFGYYPGAPDDSMFIAWGRQTYPIVGLTVDNNHCEGFGAFSDADSAQFFHVAHNTVRNSGANSGFGVGYAVQQFGHLHHNVFYNSVNTGNPAAIILGNHTNAKQVVVEENLIIDDRSPGQIVYGVTTTGASGSNFDSSDVILRRNRIYQPNTALNATFANKKDAGDTLPRLIEAHDVVDSGGYKRVQQAGTVTPPGVTLVAVGASPWTYTNTETVDQIMYVKNGTVTHVIKNSQNLFDTTDVTVFLAPGESMQVQYTAVPAVWRDRRQ